MLSRLIRGFLERGGYLVQWAPSVMSDAGNRVPISLEFFIGHLMLFRPNPVFLEIGANDGVANDAIFPFVQRFGFSGIMVEPLPATFKTLQSNYRDYPSVHLVNAAIGDSNGERTMYKLRDYEGQYANASQFASFNRELVASQTAYVPNAANEIEEIRVPCMTVETVLARSGFATVDILIIDAEGYDGQILRMIDFTKIAPSIVQFEHANMDKAERESVANLLVKAGYRLFNDPLDTIAYRAVDYLGWAERARVDSLIGTGKQP